MPRKGAHSSNCPLNAMFCTERRVDHRGPLPALKKKATIKPGVMKSGMVEGKQVNKILLDTECSRTLVHQDLVPEEKFLEGEAVAIRCAHGNTILYPLAQISMEVEGNPIESRQRCLTHCLWGFYWALIQRSIKQSY